MPPRPQADSNVANLHRVRADGKFFRLGHHRWHPKGVTYGPFRPREEGWFIPPRAQVQSDFDAMQRMGINAIRVYHPPPRWLLDDACERGIRVLIDIPWQKHRCFFEDWPARQDAIDRVRRTARELGDHPGVFALSVANEVPTAIVRFYGAARVERFIERLMDVARKEAPDCLVTYTNYPSTEYLCPRQQDFTCFNVYLDDPETLGRYLDRLQHVAGDTPLVLGEYGLDSWRHGDERQAQALRRHVEQVFQKGLAGSFVFAYTDEWFTGGHEIEDWAFGIVDRHRCPKPAAAALAEAWSRVPLIDRSRLPKVSVVVCSYNGASTLEQCLESLGRLDYPDYEIILVDDGSTDRTPEIAARYPDVRCIRQDNQGLSVARNVGARVATGDVVAYSDSDCVADESWLLYLMTAMQDQDVEAIGGPNITPDEDGWVAKCVAVSPGNPAHVMLDDRLAEHIPGCNMAFRRDLLLKIGGFDPQFRQAGDDVDICWRFMDEGWRIGYAPAAVVWHHRRCTAKAFYRQQKGYGRAEAMLQFKHPARFNSLSCSRWSGVIYGDRAAPMAVREPVIYHGRFGEALFQFLYRPKEYRPWVYFTFLEWHLLAGFFAVLSLGLPAFASVSLIMWTLTLASAARAAWYAPLPEDAPSYCRLLVMFFQLMQPVTRSWHHYAYRLQHWKQAVDHASELDWAPASMKRISAHQRDMYWQSHEGVGREQLLDAMVQAACQKGWPGDFHNPWERYDMALTGDVAHRIHVLTVTEELGGPKRFTRVRCTLRRTQAATLLGFAGVATAIMASATMQPWIILPVMTFLLFFIASLWVSRKRCWRRVSFLVSSAAASVGLEPFLVHTDAKPHSHDAGKAASNAAGEHP
jgi:GT2 family glycosyltransferase